MRKLAFVLLASGLAAAVRRRAGPEPSRPPPSTIMSAPSPAIVGDEEAAPEEDANGDRPRVTATRGFALSGSGNSSGARQRAARHSAAPHGAAPEPQPATAAGAARPARASGSICG